MPFSGGGGSFAGGTVAGASTFAGNVTVQGTLAVTGATTSVVNQTLSGTLAVTVSSAVAFTVAKAGTDYLFTVDSATASAVTGVKITGAAAAAGVAVVVTSTGANEALSINSKGSGAINLASVSTGNVALCAGGGVLVCGTGPTTHTDAAGKILSAALNTVAVAQGGTGATTAAGARVALLPAMTSKTLQVLRVNAGETDAEWATVAGGAAWTGITAGSGVSTTANGDSSIVYQTAQTTAGRISWQFTESAAGVSTGTPVLLQVDTIAASTAVPLLVKARGTSVLEIPAVGGQVLVAGGTLSLPGVAWTTDTDSGLYSVTGDVIGIVLGGTQVARLRTTGSSFTDNGSAKSTPGGVVSVHYTGTPSSASCGVAVRHAAANANAPTINLLKARGGFDSETVVTTGDDLGQISAFGYAGATGGFVEAARILFDSTGTIANTTTGIGGIIRFLTRDVGGALTEQLSIGATGGLTVPVTITAVGTTGNQTINKVAGRVNIAAGGTTIVVTNSLVTANSIVIAVAATADATARVTNVVPAAGSFTINTVAVTAETAFNFLVIS